MDGHDSHWDPDSLELLNDKHVNAFFLKPGDSENDQPKDNGSNCKVKAIYDFTKEEWREQYATTPFTPAYFNKVIVQTWEKFMTVCAPIIQHSFIKTSIHPLRPPSETPLETCAEGLVASMQMPSGEACDEVMMMNEDNLDIVDFSVTESTDKAVIIKAKRGVSASRNIIIRSIAWDIVNKTTVKPAQEIQKEIHDHARASKNRLSITANSKNKDRRTNQDTSAGLYIGSAARIVEDNRQRILEEKKAAKEANQKKIAERRSKQEELFFTLVQKIRQNGIEGINKTVSKDLQQIYIFLGGILSVLPNKKKQTVIDALKIHDTIKKLLEGGAVELPEVTEDTGDAEDIEQNEADNDSTNEEAVTLQ